MGNLRISVDSEQSSTTIENMINGLSNDAPSIVRLGDVLHRIASGQSNAKVRVNTSPVQASGTIAFSSFVATDTVTINGNVLTGSDTPSGASQFLTGVSDESSANALAALINASALNLIVGCVGAKRRGTIAFSSFATTNYITVNGLVFTGKTSPTDGDKFQFKIGGSDSSTAENAMNAILACKHPAVAGISITRSTSTLTFNFLGTLTLAVSANGTATSKTIVIYSLIPGQIGNLCSLAISAHGSVSGANLTGGTEGTQFIYSSNYTAV
jgi:hypothetical protein